MKKINKNQHSTIDNILKLIVFVVRFSLSIVLAYFLWAVGVVYFISRLDINIILGIMLMILFGMLVSLVAFWIFFRLLVFNHKNVK